MRTSASAPGPRSPRAARPRVVTLHGTDLRHPRTRLLTRAALPRIDLVATVSAELAARAARRRQAPPRRAPLRRRHRSLPPARRARRARAGSGSTPSARYLLFPADPARPAKRHDRAAELAAAHGAAAHARRRRPGRRRRCGSTPPTPSSCPPSARASASPCSRRWPATCPCSPRPSASTRGARRRRRDALRALRRGAWRAALHPLLAMPDPRVEGRARAELWSATRMAERVAAAWAELTGARVYSPREAPNDGARLV